MPPRQRIQAVTFDVGGTLITPRPSVGDVYSDVAARHGYPGLSARDLELRFREAWRRTETFQHGRDDWARLVDRVFRGLVPEPPSRTFFGALYEEFARPDVWMVYDDVVSTLDWLAGMGMSLGVISNWDERLRPLLHELRLDRYFDAIVISCELGFAKPSPVIFEEALRQLGCPASGVLHVGDQLMDDFSGAISAGFTSLHLRRDAPSTDLQVQSLREIRRWLAG